MHTVMVAGATGFFGGRIAEKLALEPSIRLLIGGRDAGRLHTACSNLGLSFDRAVAIDVHAADLASTLSRHRVDTLIHTAGPFQGQAFDVAEAAIAARCHYIDLADGRDFVSGIAALNDKALAAGVSVISGASSVPALSSAVVDRYSARFARLESIRIGISSGARSPGIATVRGVFGYCGKPIERWEDGCWTTTYGWLDLQRHRFPPPIGQRLLGSCDVPDLALFPQRFPDARTVMFHAGFANPLAHGVVWALAGLVRYGLLPGLVPLAGALHRIGGWLEPFVSDKSGMFVELEGVDGDGRVQRAQWHLIASRNHGPYIPCGAAIALARRLASGHALPRGAMPCVGLLSVAEYLAELRDLDVREVTDKVRG